MSMGPACCAATRGGRRAFLIDYRTAPEHSQLETTAAGDDHADGFARGGVFGQG